MGLRAYILNRRSPQFSFRLHGSTCCWGAGLMRFKISVLPQRMVFMEGTDRALLFPQLKLHSTARMWLYRPCEASQLQGSFQVGSYQAGSFTYGRRRACIERLRKYITAISGLYGETDRLRFHQTTCCRVSDLKESQDSTPGLSQTT